MTVDKLITGGKLVFPDKVLKKDLAIDQGKIVAVGKTGDLPDGKDVIDASGKIVLPGVIDPHVHIDPDHPDQIGDYETETTAAALGGVTTLIDFAWQEEGMDEKETSIMEGIKNKKAYEKDSLVDFSVHAALTEEDARVLDGISKAVDNGITSFKLFMSTYDFGVSVGFIQKALRAIEENNAVALVHAENAEISSQLTTEFREAEREDPTWFPKSRPDYVEAMGTEDIARLAEEIGVKYYNVHTSNRKSAQVIEQFQDRGGNIRGETCTHYVALDESVYESQGNLPLVNPPIRKEEDRSAVLDHLKKGVLSVVGTDHVAWSGEEKMSSVWWESPVGNNTIQFSLPVFHDVAINMNELSYPFLARVMSLNPAKTFGLSQKGSLHPGNDADVVIFDPSEGSVISSDDLGSGSDYTIYEGRQVNGTVDKTLVRGSVVVDSGELLVDPGHGSFVEREIPGWEMNGAAF